MLADDEERAHVAPAHFRQTDEMASSEAAALATADAEEEGPAQPARAAHFKAQKDAEDQDVDAPEAAACAAPSQGHAGEQDPAAHDGAPMSEAPASGSTAAGSEPEGAAAEPAKIRPPERVRYHARPEDEKTRKNNALGRRIALAAVAVIIIAVVGVGVAFAMWMASLNELLGLDDETESAELEEVLVQTEDDDGAFYMLILGSDAREDETSRSDVIMLVRVDPAAATVTLVSIPRDTMVYIDGHWLQKINAAYAYDGASGAVETVSEFAGVEISHYVEVHFEEFVEVIDALGGIEVNVPQDISFDGETIEAGEQTLTGEQALAFARDRYHVSGGDFGRAQAQRMIVEAVARKVLDSSATELPGIVSELAGSISTDLAASDLVGLALEFWGEDLTFYSAACPSYTYEYAGVSYVATMYDAWRAMMQRVDAGLDPEDEDAEIPEEQLENEALGAATNAAGPEDYEELAASAGLTTDDVVEVD